MLLNRLEIRRRIVDLAFRLRLSHLGSSLTCVDILCDIYQIRQEYEPVVLSNGHAGLALYVVLEAVFGLDAEQLYQRHGIHPSRNEHDQIYVTTGSLGMGLPVALGMALADRSNRVFCVISDGECAEGAIWESLAIKTRFMVDNLRIYVNVNGFSAYDTVDVSALERRLVAFDKSVEIRHTLCALPFAPDCRAHYHVISEDEYHWVLTHLEEIS